MSKTKKNKYDSDRDKHKSKKKNKRSRSREREKSKKLKEKQGESSSSHDIEQRFRERLIKKRDERKMEEKKKKAMLKEKESTEEKRMRRLRKKEAKERKRKEKMGWDNEYLHYTNEDNPYGDNNLLDTFIWGKKLEKEGLSCLSKDEIRQRNYHKMEENRHELEKVKKRRLERERERAEREKDMEMEQRQKEANQFSLFSKQEDVFQLEQARIRSEVRIKDGRAKPIDLLAQYVNSEGDVNAADMHEPYTHLTGLTKGDLEDLVEDIKVYQQLEKQNENQFYWIDLLTIVHDELRRLKQKSSGENQRQGIHSSVAKNVSEVFVNMSAAKLEQMKSMIEKDQLGGNRDNVDVGYWESLLSQLKAHLARERLKERHKDLLKKKLEILKAEQGVQEDGSISVDGGSKQSDEVQFSVEAKLDNQTYLWSDKYRPRKLRYFNRVHTGFEWNKYNQTHYDMDNPPPKIVQGYNFNNFYPVLIDKSNTPQYELIAIDDNKDFSILKFSAGPPYEDIAFKIVNREWEYSYKKGFRCQFHNNIFQLWFHFKRYRYRR